MRYFRGFRFSIGTLMMFVLAAAAGAALFAKARLHTGAVSGLGLKTDVPLLLLMAIGLTSVALGAWKEHSLNQILLQGTLACVGCLSLIWISEAGLERTVRYWFQGMFAATVALPIVARSRIKVHMERGPRRDWWKKTCEACFFSFLALLLVSAGGLLQALIAVLAPQAFEITP